MIRLSELLRGRALYRRARIACALGFMAATAAGCWRGRGEAALAASLDAPAAAAAERAAAVAVAVGDRVKVKVWRETDYSDELTVDAAGQIVLPRLGPVRVAGLSIASVQDTLRGRFATYLRNPVVTVTILRRIALQGEVRSPGLYYVDPTVTLRDAIAQAGGLTEAANAAQVQIVREGRQQGVRTAARGGTVAEIRSGDAIVIGRRSWLSRNALAVVSTLGLVVSVGVQVFRR